MKSASGQPCSDRYKRLDQKPYDSFYLYVETILDHPVEKVWMHALNVGGWMSAHRLETIAGEPGQVGYFQRVYPAGVGDDIPLPHYHLYGIAAIIPPKLIVLEVFPEKGGSYGKTRQKLSFDSILLTDLGDRTVVGFHMVDVHLGKGESDFAQRRQTELEGVRGMLHQYFENLRALVSGAAEK